MGAPQYEQAGADIGGSGTADTIPRWTGASTLGDSILSQSGAIITNSGTFRAASGSPSEPGYTFAASTGTGMYRAASDALLRFAVSGAYAFGVDSSGRVGIGTASPSYNLQVAGTTAFSNALVQTTAGAAGGSILSVNTSGFSGDRVPLSITGHASQAYNFLQVGVASPGDKFVVSAAGNVGIGTASPTAALDTPASTTTRATLRIRSGVAPTAPNTGDVWFDGTSLFMRNGAGTQTVSFGGGGGATAWVNFNGTGVIAIRASSNVSSITDVAVGQYVVNFTSAMPDINYSAIGTKQNVSTNTDVSLYDCIGAVASVPARTANASGWLCLEGAAFFDSANVNIAYFR